MDRGSLGRQSISGWMEGPWEDGESLGRWSTVWPLDACVRKLLLRSCLGERKGQPTVLGRFQCADLSDWKTGRSAVDHAGCYIWQAGEFFFFSFILVFVFQTPFYKHVFTFVIGKGAHRN